MANDLQDVVDRVTLDLGAAAALVDTRLRMIAYSSSTSEDPIDDARRRLILHRRAEPGAIAWLRRRGVFAAHEPVWIRPQPELATLGRLCCPIRYHGLLLGFLWLLDRHDAHDGTVPMLRDYCERIAALLYDSASTRRATSALVSHLVSEVPELEVSAASSIIDRELWPHAARVCAVVATVAEPDHAVASEEQHAAVHAALVQTLDQVTHSAVAPRALPAAFAEHVVVLLPCWSDEDDGPLRVAPAMARALSRRLRQHRETDQLRAVVGVGEPQLRLAEAQVSHRQARMAARVASRIPSLGPVAHWRDLGVYRTLVQLPSWSSRDLDLDHRVATLFRDADSDLLCTLETYLDLGCDMQQTAARLHAHRGTIYNRLEKVERLTGLQLHDGNDRLSVHLGFKIAHLAHLYPS